MTGEEFDRLPATLAREALPEGLWARRLGKV